MTNPRFNKIISLNDQDNKRLEVLRKLGHKIVDIFRKGMEELEKHVYRP
jgi:hypothetical protein